VAETIIEPEFNDQPDAQPDTAPAPVTESEPATPAPVTEPEPAPVAELPLESFELADGGTLTLSPESYVMKISPSLLSLTGKINVGKGKVIVLRRKSKSSLLQITTRSDAPVCTYAFMESPITEALVGGEKHQVMILGIPVFREYNIKFDRKAETLAFSQHSEGVDCETSPARLATSLAQSRRKSAGELRLISSLTNLRYPIF
jgi:hypothetical protein